MECRADIDGLQPECIEEEEEDDAIIGNNNRREDLPDTKCSCLGRVKKWYVHLIGYKF